MRRYNNTDIVSSRDEMDSQYVPKQSHYRQLLMYGHEWEEVSVAQQTL